MEAEGLEAMVADLQRQLAELRDERKPRFKLKAPPVFTGAADQLDVREWLVLAKAYADSTIVRLSVSLRRSLAIWVGMRSSFSWRI